jgi:hypothetical protein
MIVSPDALMVKAEAETKIIVSMLMFSGLPNPSVEITSDNIDELAKFFEGLQPTEPPWWESYPFGGFLILNLDPNETRIPPIARVFQGVIWIQKEGQQYFIDNRGLERWLHSMFGGIA